MTNPNHEELTAYLDGELDLAARRRVEDRLRNDASYRRELQRLERAWDMLDHLDRAEAGETFANTTLEMVAVAAANDARRSLARLPGGRMLAVIALLMLAAGLGFAAGRRVWPDPNESLKRDLPILENIDLYDQGDSIEFLRKLQRSGVFDEEAEHGQR